MRIVSSFLLLLPLFVSFIYVFFLLQSFLFLVSPKYCRCPPPKYHHIEISLYLSIYHIITLERCRSLAKQEIFRCHSRTRHSPPTCTKRRSNCDFASASRAIFATANCLCPTARRKRLARPSSSSRSIYFIEKIRNSIRIATWSHELFQQFVFSLVIFHIFFSLNRRTLPRNT